MPIPDYQGLLLPVLRFLEDGQEHSLREKIDSCLASLQLSEDIKGELFPIGRQPVLDNRLDSARTHLKNPGLGKQPSWKSIPSRRPERPINMNPTILELQPARNENGAVISNYL